jgi:hypothetical protein
MSKTDNTINVIRDDIKSLRDRLDSLINQYHIHYQLFHEGHPANTQAPPRKELDLRHIALLAELPKLGICCKECDNCCGRWINDGGQGRERFEQLKCRLFGIYMQPGFFCSRWEPKA